MSVFRVQPKPGEEPHKWKVEKFAEIGWENKFVRHVTELITILGGTTIFDKQREDVNNAIMAILMDGLMTCSPEISPLEM